MPPPRLPTHRHIIPNLNEKLPVEILQAVFSYLCVPDDYYRSPFGGGHPISLRTSPIEALLQVSSYWRACAIGYAPLFSVISWSLWPMDKLRCWIERGTSSAGLAITISYQWWDTKNGSIKDTEIDPERLVFLCSLSVVWRSLIILGSDLNAVTPQLLKLPTPLLKHLVIDTGHSARWEHTLQPIPTIFNASDSFAPHLATLILLGSLIRRSSRWENISTVDVDFPRRETTMYQNWPPLPVKISPNTHLVLRSDILGWDTFLSTFERIEHLVLFDWHDDWLPSSSPLILFPALRVVELSTRRDDGYDVIVSRFGN